METLKNLTKNQEKAMKFMKKTYSKAVIIGKKSVGKSSFIKALTNGFS